MNVIDMRRAVMEMYKHSKNWQQRVEKMADNQVIAIYKKYEKEVIICQKSSKHSPAPVQLSLFC